MSPKNHGKKWSPGEEKYLSFFWGVRSMSRICSELGRTPYSVLHKVRLMSLGSPARGTWSIRSVEKFSGFSQDKICNAIKKLGMIVAKPYAGNTAVRGKKTMARKGLTDEQVDELVQYMLKHSYVYSDEAGRKRTTKGTWGVGCKPESCVLCHKTDNPHYGKGKCRRCYNKEQLRNRRTGNKRSRPKKTEPLLTPDDIIDMRNRRASSETYDSISSDFGISRQAVAKITKGKAWKHAGGPIEELLRSENAKTA